MTMTLRSPLRVRSVAFVVRDTWTFHNGRYAACLLLALLISDTGRWLEIQSNSATEGGDDCKQPEHREKSNNQFLS